MPPKTPEDILQAIYDATQEAIRTTVLEGGAREHREQAAVSTIYSAATNSISFGAPKRHVRIYCTQDMYWVDSATSDLDAETKLTSADQRGYIKQGDRLEISLATGITRLDFLAVNTAGAVYVTGLD